MSESKNFGRLVRDWFDSNTGLSLHEYIGELKSDRKSSAKSIREKFDQLVEEWHEAAPGVSLYEYLVMTWEEYCQYLSPPNKKAYSIVNNSCDILTQYILVCDHDLPTNLRRYDVYFNTLDEGMSIRIQDIIDINILFWGDCEDGCNVFIVGDDDSDYEILCVNKDYDIYEQDDYVKSLMFRGISVRPVEFSHVTKKGWM